MPPPFSESTVAYKRFELEGAIQNPILVKPCSVVGKPVVNFFRDRVPREQGHFRRPARRNGVIGNLNDLQCGRGRVAVLRYVVGESFHRRGRIVGGQFLMERFEENMADIVNHYVLAAIGNQIDLNDQLEYILAELDENKKSILEDITHGG